MTQAQQKQEEKKYTEREMAVAQQSAFTRGAANARANVHAVLNIDGVYGNEKLVELTKRACEKHYPLPKVTRKRTITIIGGNSGHPYTLTADGPATVCINYGAEIPVVDAVTSLAIYHKPIDQQIKDLQALQDLLANPEELVDDEG